MAFIIKALGAGALTTNGATVDVYTVPDPKSAMVTSVQLVNTNLTNSATVNVYVKPSGGNARRIAKSNDSLAVGTMLVLEDVLTLGKGDKLQVHVAGTAPNVAYMVNGMERD